MTDVCVSPFLATTLRGPATNFARARAVERPICPLSRTPRRARVEAKVRMSGLDRTRDAIDLVAATVGAPGWSYMPSPNTAEICQLSTVSAGSDRICNGLQAHEVAVIAMAIGCVGSQLPLFAPVRRRPDQRSVAPAAADLLAASLVTVKPSTKPKSTSLVVWP
jgi:hypothetical protein